MHAYRTVLALALAGLLAGSLIATSSPTQSAGLWTAANIASTVRGFAAATQLPTGKVLVVGGCCTPSLNSLSTADLFDPVTVKWQATGSLRAARQRHTATLLPNGNVLVVGGQDSSGYLSSAELYNVAAGTWSNTGGLTTARSGHTATLLSNGKVLVAGGQGAGGASLGSAELYDPNTGVWTSTGGLGVGRFRHTATLLTTGKVLVAGGQTSGGTSLSSAELYDPAAGAWSSSGSLNTARSGHTATLLPTGKVLVAGGGGASSAFSSAELYDAGTGAFGPTSSMSTARTDQTATLTQSGLVLVAGGRNGFGVQASSELFDPVAGIWGSTDSMLAPLYGQTATLITTAPCGAICGNVVVAGTASGYHGPFLGDAQLFAAPNVRPVVRSLAPASGPLAGGTTVTLSGTAFTGATQVLFGTTAATQFTVVSSTQLTATSPAHADGPVHVTVATIGGASTPGAGDQFTYAAPPVAAGQNVLVIGNTATPITLSASDSDSPTLTMRGLSGPTNGVLASVGTPTCTLSGAGSTCTASVTYTPNSGYRGSDSFTFTANDGTADATPATVALNVTYAAFSLPLFISPASAALAATAPTGSQAAPFAQGGTCVLNGTRNYDSYPLSSVSNFNVQVTPGTIPSVTVSVYKVGYNPDDGCQNAVAVFQATGGSASLTLRNTGPGQVIIIVSGTTASDFGTYSLSVQ